MVSKLEQLRQKRKQRRLHIKRVKEAQNDLSSLEIGDKDGDSQHRLRRKDILSRRKQRNREHIAKARARKQELYRNRTRPATIMATGDVRGCFVDINSCLESDVNLDPATDPLEVQIDWLNGATCGAQTTTANTKYNLRKRRESQVVPSSSTARRAAAPVDNSTASLTSFLPNDNITQEDQEERTIKIEFIEHGIDMNCDFSTSSHRIGGSQLHDFVQIDVDDSNSNDISFNSDFHFIEPPEATTLPFERVDIVIKRYRGDINYYH